MCFFILRMRLRVLAKHPAFPAPSLDGGKLPQNSGGRRREIAKACFRHLKTSQAGAPLLNDAVHDCGDRDQDLNTLERPARPMTPA
jgi:hypothetical protein